MGGVPRRAEPVRRRLAHRALMHCRWLRVTPTQYRDAISRLGLSQVEAAHFLGLSVRTSHGYANDQPVPRAIALLLRLMIDWQIDPRDL